jgi:hypothetical protein
MSRSWIPTIYIDCNRENIKNGMNNYCDMEIKVCTDLGPIVYCFWCLVVQSLMSTVMGKIQNILLMNKECIKCFWNEAVVWFCIKNHPGPWKSKIEHIMQYIIVQQIFFPWWVIQDHVSLKYIFNELKNTASSNEMNGTFCLSVLF